MKNFFIVIAVLIIVSSIRVVAAQVPVARDADLVTDTTAREEAEGKAVWERLQAGQVACADLSVDDHEVLGEYYMGLMLGDTKSHEAMNRTMTLMMGEDGEKQMHVAMGKRLSGCDTTAAYAPQGRPYLPTMMGMMGPAMMFGGYGPGVSYGMMGLGASSAYWAGWVTQLLLWTILVLAVIALSTWIKRQGKK